MRRREGGRERERERERGAPWEGEREATRERAEIFEGGGSE